MFRDMGPFENEGVDMPSELSRWVVLSSLRFKVEKDTPFLKVLKASFFCSKNMPMTAAIRVQLRSVGTMQIWWEFWPVNKSEWLTTPTV
jgi:hypothetical protein